MIHATDGLCEQLLIANTATGWCPAWSFVLSETFLYNLDRLPHRRTTTNFQLGFKQFISIECLNSILVLS